jgi:hypothetical protein
MDTRPDTICIEIELRLVVSDGPDRAVHTDLSYATSDPYAVRVAFHTGSGEVVEWTFARSLLVDGITRPVGEGDVHVWPAAGTRQPMVWLSLSSPSGEAMFEASLPQVVKFLSETNRLVPTGCESDYVDVDAELAALLDAD